LKSANQVEEIIPVDLTKKQIEDSPTPSEHEPVSRQFEVQYSAYYGQPMYWSGLYAWGPVAYPTHYRVGCTDTKLDYFNDDKNGESHLRSTQAVMGY